MRSPNPRPSKPSASAPRRRAASSPGARGPSSSPSEGLATLERWLGENDVLFLRRNDAEPIIVLPWRVWALLLGGETGR
jgi:hypothetical protein